MFQHQDITGRKWLYTTTLSRQLLCCQASIQLVFDKIGSAVVDESLSPEPASTEKLLRRTACELHSEICLAQNTPRRSNLLATIELTADHINSKKSREAGTGQAFRMTTMTLYLHTCSTTAVFRFWQQFEITISPG